MELSSVAFALILTVFAGLSTGIGSAIAFVAHRTNTKLLTLSLGFSAGVMVYISFVEIFPGAKEIFIERFGETRMKSVRWKPWTTNRKRPNSGSCTEWAF